MNIFYSPSPYPFGLDISDYSLKLVQLNRRRNYIFLQAINRVEVPKGFIEDGEIKNKIGVLELVNKLTSETIFGKISGQEVVACVPETKTFIKLLEVPQEKKSTAQAVEEEIKKNIPFSIEEVSYDWQQFGQDKNGRKIIMGVVPKNIIESYYELLTEAGLYPVALETEPVAITRSLFPPYLADGQTKIIIDIGAARSSFIAYHKGMILFTISLPISGQKVTEIIAKELKINIREAEMAKVVCGLDPKLAEGVVAEALEKMVRNIISKIKNSIKYLKSNYPEYGEVEKIYLCGGGAKIKGLVEMIGKELGKETEIGNVFLNIKVSPRFEKKYLHEEFAALKKIARNRNIKQNFSIRFATAVGLALRGVYIDEI